MLCVLALSAALAVAPSLDADIRAVASLDGQPHLVGAAGLDASEGPLLTLENDEAFDPSSRHRRLVVIGGRDADDASVRAVVGFVRWFKTRAPAALRRDWAVSALPSSAFVAADSASLERWVTFQSPDLLVQVRGDGAVAGITAMASESVTIRDTAAAIAKLMAAAPAGRSPLHDVMLKRVGRDPIDMARMLARRYPETPAISYISAVAWTSTLRVADLARDPSLTNKVREQTAPWIAGGRPLFGDRIQLTSVAGGMIFADLGGDALPRALDAARLAVERKDDGIARYGQGWTDDMFMVSAILSRMGTIEGHQGDLDAAASLLTAYAARLQRPDGIFMHSTDGPFAWGRGNGFAALGVVETLSRLPERHAARAGLLTVYRKQMAALVGQQSPDGSWRQVIDEPGAYREETATAMILSAMTRGLRAGWLDRSYRSTVDRAWRALAAHVTDEGTLVDVCTGTGAGPTRRYYLDRAAITGADDRGGAMALLAAVEYGELRRLSSRRPGGNSSAAPTAR